MKTFKAIFAKPSIETRPWAIWIWNLTVTQEEIESQLNSFVQNGFGGVAIKPGRDMFPSFLSHEFVAGFKRALAIGKEKGIGIRFVADLGLPWNTGIEELAQSNPEYRAHKLVLEKEETLHPKTTLEKTIDDYRNAVAMVAKSVGGKVAGGDTKVFNLNQSKGVVSWKVPSSEWKFLVFRKVDVLDPCGNYMPNVFNVKTAHAYTQNVLDVLKAASAEHSPAFKGIVLEMQPIIPADNTIPWDDDLVVKYRAKFKKELLPLLPSVFCDSDASLHKNRSHIFNHLLQSSYERFAMITEAWAKKNHLSQWTLAATRSLAKIDNGVRDFLSVPEANLAAVGAQNQGGTDEDFHVLATHAAVNQGPRHRQTVVVLGRNRNGTGSSLLSLKAEFDLAMQLGFATVLVDGFHMNLDQRNLLKSPFNAFWYSPDWGHGKAFTDYVANFLEAIKDLHYNRQIAVLNTWESVLADFVPTSDEAIRKASATYRSTILELRNAHLDFDIVSESALLACTVRETGEIVPADKTKKGSYAAVIVPCARLISKSMLVFLEKLGSRKGTVLIIGEAPQGSFEDGITKSFSDRVEKLLASKRASIRTLKVESLGEALAAGFKPNVSILSGGKPCPDIHCLAGSGDDFNAYHLVNVSETIDHYTTIEIPESKTVAMVDSLKGEIQELIGVQKGEGTSVITFNIAPKQSCLVIATKNKLVAATLKRDKKHPINTFGAANRNYRIVLKDQWNFKPLSLNALPLAVWNMRIGLSRESGGFSHFYDSTFVVKESPKQCLFTLGGFPLQAGEFGGLDKALEVTVNGNRLLLSSAAMPIAQSVIETSTDIPWFYRNSIVFDIKSMLTRGFNRVALRTIGSYSDPISLLYPPAILGDFSILKGSKGWVIDSPIQTCGYDSWTQHGFNYFTGVGSYKQVFEIPSAYERLVMRFNRLSGFCEVLMNGNPLGSFNWPPMELDVTAACESKRNELELRVTNTVDNVLRLNGRLSGILGEVHLDVY